MTLLITARTTRHNPSATTNFAIGPVYESSHLTVSESTFPEHVTIEGKAVHIDDLIKALNQHGYCNLNR